MKRILLVIFTLISLNAFSQLQVKEGSFKHIPNAVMNDKYEHLDGNDLPMALIKISTENIPEQERLRIKFQGNLATQITKTPKTGQMWIYISAENATFINFMHPDYGTYKYYLPEKLCDFCTYEMVLQYVEPKPELGFLAISSEPTDADIYIDGKHYGKTNNVITDLAVGTHELKLEKEGYASLTKTFVTTKGETLKLNETLQAISNKKVHLIVKADQENATVYIDDEPLGTKEASKLFMLGTSHTWMIKCNMYHTESGTVTLSDRTVIDKKLRPNYGFLNISTTPEQDAKVFVDEEYVGLSPVKTDKLKSGTHTVRVMKDMYKMAEKSFTVNDGQTTNATLNMSANFVTLTLTVDSDSDTDTDSDSDIYVDEEYKGKGKWTGRLSEGFHIFEARKTNHKPSKKSMDLVLGENKTITLDAPTPINGEIEINTTPMGATIYIDGKSYGETPNYISAILIGEHELKLTKQGCVEIKKTIVIKEGEALTINEKLQTGKEISISTDQSGNKIYVDGNYVGVSPLTTNLSYGSHEIKAEREGKTVSETINVMQSGGNDGVMLAFIENQTFTVKGVTFTMIAVEGGTFKMGAQSSDSGGDNYDSEAGDRESPVHDVTLSSYYIGETEVTQELWQAVMGSNPSNFSGYPQRPVETVSWYDCKEFVTKLNELTGENFRLPTEAEWEYAARGGNRSKGYKYSGSNTIGNVAWYDSNSGNETHDVKTKQANELGIYDMSGNVWEWCQDWYGSYSSGSQTNPTGPTSGSIRVSRGGSWYYYAKICQISDRSYSLPDYMFYYLGLRLSLSQ
ncbi:MAG: PEGA domain-containing protein [Bacteroidales bacterium]|nr:PEGA domain-containing protein [Bacteroidales bacterium]